MAQLRFSELSPGQCVATLATARPGGIMKQASQEGTQRERGRALPGRPGHTAHRQQRRI